VGFIAIPQSIRLREKIEVNQLTVEDGYFAGIVGGKFF